MSLDNLPVEWISLNLGKVVEYGKTAKVEPSQIKDETWVLELEDIEKDSSKILNQISFAERKSKSTKNSFDSGDVLYGKLRPYLNKVVMAPKDGVCTTEIIPLNGNGHVLNKFLFYWIKGNVFQNYVQAVSYGVNMPRLGTNDGLKAPFILVPIAEQLEIVRQLDVMLAQVEQIKARLDAIPALLKKFRQSVLADAVSGDLLKNTNLIFNKLALKKLTTKIGSGATPKGGNSAYQEVGIPLVRSLNIHTNYIKYKDLAFINQEQADKLKNVEIFKDDVLLNITGASIGRVNITPKEFIGGRVNQHVAIIRCDQTKLLPQYLHIYLASPNLQKWIEGENYGATRQALTKGMLDSLVVEFPSIEDQIKIISKVNELFNFSNTIEQTAQSAQKRVNLLTQSILAKAFSGELTAEWREQHQELITGINSAESLLAKIQAGREVSKPVKKVKKVK